MLEPRFAERVDLSEVVFTRFHPGDDLFGMIRKTLSEAGWERGVILSAIGSLVNVTFVDLKPGVEIPINRDKVNLVEMKGPFELLSLEGSVVPLVGEFADMKDDDPVLHFHAILGHEGGHITGGHMAKGFFERSSGLVLPIYTNCAQTALDRVAPSGGQELTQGWPQDRNTD